MIFNTSFGSINLGTLDGILKADGSGHMMVAEPEVDYQEPIIAGQDYSLPVKTTSITLSASGWVGEESPFSHSLSITGVTNNTKIDLQPNAEALAQLITDTVAGMYIENNNGTLTAYAVGAKPSVNLTMQVTLTEIGG